MKARFAVSLTAQANRNDPQPCRVDGEIKHLDLNRPIVCRCAKELPGFSKDNPDTYTQCRMARQDSDLVCPACGRIIHILNDEEYYQEVTFPKLHLVNMGHGMLQLSAKLPAREWEKVKKYFVFWCAETLDEMDCFDMSGGYYLCPGEAEEGEVLNRAPLANPSTIEIVEEILGILPENRFRILLAEAALAAAKAKEETDAKEALRQRIAAAFSPNSEGAEYPRGENDQLINLQGLVINDGERPDIYGGGAVWVIEPAGDHIWYVRKNGADGDCWASTNTNHGLGRRFPFDTERQEIMSLVSPGWRDDLAAYQKAATEFAAVVATLTATKMVPRLPAGPDGPRYVTWIDMPGNKQQFDLDGVIIYNDPQTHTRYAPSAVVDAWAQEHWACLVAQVGETQAGRKALNYHEEPHWAYLIERDGEQHYIDLATASEWLVKAGFERWDKRGADRLGLQATMLACVRQYEPGMDRDTMQEACMILFDTRYRPDFWVHPDGRIFAGIDHSTGVASLHDISHLGAADFAQAAKIYRDRKAAQAEKNKVEHYRKIAKMPEIAKVISSTNLDRHEQERHSSGEYAHLDRVVLQMKDDGERQIWTVTSGWWAMGEDGDAGEITTAYQDEASARAAFAKEVR